MFESIRRALLAASVAGAALLVGATQEAWAFAWVEDGDAGQTLTTLQVVSGSGDLETISGTIGNDPNATFSVDDADVYAINIVNTGTFSASTVNNGGSATFDTQLFLFDENGIGVVANDDTPGVAGFGSTITNEVVATLSAGIYYLAISGWNNDPLSASGAIWDQPDGSPLVYEQLEPNGPGASDALTDWSNTSIESGTYTIAFTVPGSEGAVNTGGNNVINTAKAPEPASLVLLGFGLIAAGYLRRRRVVA